MTETTREEPVFLDGIAVEFYRGIGADTQFIAPFAKMNFFIGPNNAGKSIVLKLIHERMPLSEESGQELTGTEEYRGDPSGLFNLAVGVSKSTIHKELSEVGKEIDRQKLFATPNWREGFANYLASGGVFWRETKGRSLGAPTKSLDTQHVEQLLWQDGWLRLYEDCTGRTHYQYQMAAGEVLRELRHSFIPKVTVSLLLDAKRDIDGDNSKYDTQLGSPLIQKLAALQSPGNENHAADRAVFDQINDFVTTVLDKDAVQLEVPHTQDHLIVHIDNKVLPLSSLGTGIHEVILIAAFCTIHQNKIICIEEPEIHLHPVLQRKLIRYLQEKTANQYFIATHSAAFIDTKGAAVFGVRNDGRQTYVEPLITKGEKRKIVADLGYRASDLLQSNFVIWVEGPSDRIYLAHWLDRASNGELIEDVHYTIMFYGGALISHLSVEDETLNDFIKLPTINRNFAVVLDSDKANEGDDLKPAVQRICKKMSSDHGMIWVTEGREVENYVDPDVLHAKLKEMYPKSHEKAHGTKPFDHSYHFRRKNPPKGKPFRKDIDKVELAGRAVSQGLSLDRLDLRERLGELVQLIQDANRPGEVGKLQ